MPPLLYTCACTTLHALAYFFGWFFFSKTSSDRKTAKLSWTNSRRITRTTHKIKVQSPKRKYICIFFLNRRHKEEEEEFFFFFFELPGTLHVSAAGAAAAAAFFFSYKFYLKKATAAGAATFLIGTACGMGLRDPLRWNKTNKWASPIGIDSPYRCAGQSSAITKKTKTK